MGRCNPKTNTCTRTPWWREAMGINWYGQGGGVLSDTSAEEGGVILLTSQKIISFYELTKTTGSNGAGISNGNAGLVNQRDPGTNDLVIVGSPVVRDLTINGDNVKTVQDSSTNALSLGHNGESIFNRSKFGIKLLYQTVDAIQDSPTPNLMGGIIPTNIGINMFIGATGAALPGQLQIQYGNADGVFRWASDAAYFSNGINGLVLIEIDFDFDADTVTYYRNGLQIAVSLVSGTMSAVTPGVGKWTNTSNIYLNSLNNNGTTVSNTDIGSLLAAVFTTGDLTDEETFNVRSYFYQNAFKWRNEIHISSVSEMNALKANVIATAFNGNGLPEISPTVTPGHTGAMHICNTANMTGFSSWDKYSYTINDINGDAWVNVVYWGHASSPNGKAIMNMQGHISDSASAHESFMSQAAALGYDIIFCALCIASNDNTEASPVVTAQSTTGHDQIVSGGIDRAGYSAMELYFFDKVSFLQANAGEWSEVYCCGISGGGWGTCWMGAILNNIITKSVPVRGVLLRTFKDDAGLNKEGDSEQGGSLFKSARCGPRIYALYTSSSYFDLLMMHKNVLLINHEIDTCCFQGKTYAHWRPAAYNLSRQLGNKFDQQTFTDPAQATHQYQADEITAIFNHFAS